MSEESKYSWLWFLGLKYNYVFIGIIVIIGIIHSISNPEDPIDVGAPVYRLAGVVTIVDRNANGFNVYVRNEMLLTDKRLDKLYNSDKVKGFFREAGRLERSFSGDLITTDPYVVLDAIKAIGVPDSLELYYLEGVGADKHELYCRPNPYDDSKVTTPNPKKERQGMVYLKDGDIKAYTSSSKTRTYRYMDANYHCPVSSSHDEQYSHIAASEAE